MDVAREGASQKLERWKLLFRQRQVFESAVFEKIKEVVADKLDTDPSDVNESSSFVDDLGADSLDLVELIMAMEEAFGIEIPDEVAEKITTVQDAIDHVNKVG